VNCLLRKKSHKVKTFEEPMAERAGKLTGGGGGARIDGNVRGTSVHWSVRTKKQAVGDVGGEFKKVSKNNRKRID